MKAVILAGGYGTRLGELTKNQPKPTIVVGGKTIIENIIERLHLAGITEIIVNLHYLPTVMTENIRSNALYFYEPRLLGHEGTIRALQKWIEDDDFFVINGDTISNVNFEEMAYLHKHGTIQALMEEWRCVGTWLYCKEYFKQQTIYHNMEVIPYRPSNLVWHDCGTPERLEAARKYYDTSSKNNIVLNGSKI